MGDNIVSRLRNYSRIMQHTERNPPIYADAANLIEAQQAEIERLRSLVEMYAQIIDSEALLADFLRAALDETVEPTDAVRAWEEARND